MPGNRRANPLGTPASMGAADGIPREPMAIWKGLPRRLVLRTLRLPQGVNPLLAAQQPGRLGRPEGAAGGNRQRDAGSGGVISCLENDQHVVLAERVTTHHDLGTQRLQRWRDRLDAVVWLPDLRRHRLGGVSGLI